MLRTSFVFQYEENAQKWAGKMIRFLLEIKETVYKEKIKEGKNSFSEYFLRKFETEFDSILKTGFKRNPYQH
jgi:hypothetical protein